MRAVTGHIEAVLELLPVGLQVALVVAPDGAQHGRPGTADHQVPAFLRLHYAIPVFIDDVRLDAGQRMGCREPLGRLSPDQVQS